MNPVDILSHLHMDAGRAVTEAIKIWLIGGGLLLLLAWRWLPHRLGRGLLIGLVVLATANYARWGSRLLTERVDTYDLIHYYLNSKYFDELGYYDLYPACILADQENDGPYFHHEGVKYMAQNDAGHGYMPISHALAQGAVAKERFTPERWAEFSHDFLVLQRELPGLNDKLWRQMIQDHGFNGTPTWTLIARPIADAVPVEHVKLLGYIDLGLLLVGVGAIAWAYGGTTALWTWLFLMVTYSMRWPTLTWALLRYDYLAALMVALALLRRRSMFGAALAGVLTALSATLRFFPALYMFGPAAKGVFKLVLSKQVDRRLLVLGLSFVVGAAVIEGGTIAEFGTRTVAVHFENMMDHNSPAQLSSRRIGLALSLPFTGELEPKFIEPSRKEAIAAQKPLRYAISAVVMLVLGFGLRRARDDEAFAFGFIPFFLLTTASYYYYVSRVILAAMHAGDLKRARNVVGLGMLLGLELFSNWAETEHPGYRVFHIGWLSWGIAAYTVVMSVWFLWEAHRGGTEEAG